jgi:membrane protein DedA with SNARE-associated domain/rhodanese-related sulfurtransferase
VQQLVALIAQYGLALVFANVLVEQIGLPVPAIPTLLIAGALAADGRLSAPAIFGAAFIACTIGDVLWFVAGKLYGRRVLNFLCRISLSPDSCVRQTEYRFERWGGPTLALAKFIPGLSAVAPPLAGAMRLGWAPFLLWNSIGIVIWAGAAVGAGMLFHEGINRLILRVENLGAIALAIAGSLLAGYIALKWWERRRFYKALRLARISVEELRKLTHSGTRPVVVDVRSQIARDLDRRFIPGALAMDIAEVEARLAELPADRDIIFYCSCPNEASAAQVARKLIDLGYKRVRPLQGGLDAWADAGYEIEQRLPAA